MHRCAVSIPVRAAEYAVAYEAYAVAYVAYAVRIPVRAAILGPAQALRQRMRRMR
jgi:hypothetical protein